MKNFAVKSVAVATIALAASSASAAVFTTSIPALSGYVSAAGFADDDSKTFTITLRDLMGNISLHAGPSGTYDFSSTLTGGIGLDLDLNGSVDIGIPAMGTTELGTATVISAGLTPGIYNFAFVPGALGTNDGPGLPIGFDFDYNGVLATPFLGLINALLGTSFVDASGSGKLGVNGFVFSDGAVLNFTESEIDWVGFGGLLAAADATFGPATPNFADAFFTIRGLEITATTATEVPEPATLALLGIGLAGLGALRRRKQA